jgi:SAV_6107-like HEPN
VSSTDPRAAVVPASASALIASAHRSVLEAVLAPRSEARFAAAYLAALRAGAAVLATRARPARGQQSGRGGRSRAPRPGRPRSVWVVLPTVAPELGEWASFFALYAGKRASAEAGLPIVTAREADDMVREAEQFMAVVEDMLAGAHQSGLPLDWHRDSV